MDHAARKNRGAYFTPRDLARRLCAWAIRQPGERALDPACGDGAFLAEAERRGARVTGVDVHGPSLQAARRAVPRAVLARADFFDYCSRGERFDAVVGNPPFIRYQRLRGRERIAKMSGLSALSSSWAPFAVLAARMLKPGGRMALVVPREALFVNYGRDVFRRLRAGFRRVDVEPLEDFYFQGALQKIALLRCDGAGGAADPAEAEPWRAREIDPSALEAWRTLSRNFVPLNAVARVKLGIVTGGKDFFVLDRETIRRWNIPARNLLPVLDETPRGLRVTSVERRLLWTEDPSCVRSYLRHGERKGLPARYKCRVRKPWHRVPLGDRPDAFLSYLIYDRPRLAANEAGAYCTNTFHSVYAADPLGLSAAFLNPVTLLGIELLGRVYGGGVMKIEPGDASRILVPPRYPSRKTALSMEAEEKEALVLSMRWLHEEMGLSRSRLATVLSAYEELRERRLASAKRKSA